MFPHPKILSNIRAIPWSRQRYRGAGDPLFPNAEEGPCDASIAAGQNQWSVQLGSGWFPGRRLVRRIRAQQAGGHHEQARLAVLVDRSHLASP